MNSGVHACMVLFSSYNDLRELNNSVHGALIRGYIHACMHGAVWNEG